MIINARKTYSLLFVVVLLCQLYLPSFRYNIFLQLMVLSFVLYFGRPVVSKSFVNTILPILLILIFGCTATFFNPYDKISIVKDITHIVKPVLGVSVGYLLFRQINNFRDFIKIVVVTGALCAVYHLFRVFVFGASSQTVNELRAFGLDNFLELFALFFIFYAGRYFEKPLFRNKILEYFIKILLVVSCIMYFSRTMIVVAAIIALSLYGYSRLTIKTLKILGAGLLLVILLYAYLFSIKLDRNGTGLEAFFFKLKNAPTELFKTKIDREDHKDLWDHWRGYEAKRALALMEEKPYSYAIGTGYGSLVNLKFRAPLGDSKDGMKYISELHNGYAYVLYKTGILGLALMIVFYYRLYRFIYRKEVNPEHYFLLKIISAIGILYVFTTLTITGIYNQSDVIILILGSLLFFESKIRLENQEKGL